MENKIKRLKVLEIILISLTIVVGIITVIDIFTADPVFMLDEAALASITGLLTYLSSLVRRRIDELKNGEDNKIKTEEIEEITTKVSKTASAVKQSRKK